MRRSDREINSFEEMTDILDRSNTIRMGFANEGESYIVPVSFGYEVKDKKLIIYFHGSADGKRTEMLEKNPKVCIETDIFHGIMETPHGITTLYESLIGYGFCEEVESLSERKHGLSLILEYYNKKSYPLDRCKGIGNVHVFKITVNSLAGKRNRKEDLQY